MKIADKTNYDKFAEKWIEARRALRSDKYVTKFAKILPKHAKVLDVACGEGVPVDDKLAVLGHEVCGFDISSKLIEQARLLVPQAEYRVADMRGDNYPPNMYDGIVCLYAIFHIPRAEHGNLLTRMYKSLTKNGKILITMGDSAYEGLHEYMGYRVFASQWGSTQNLEIVRRVGFEIQIAQMDYSGGERHQYIIAEKRKA